MTTRVGFSPVQNIKRGFNSLQAPSIARRLYERATSELNAKAPPRSMRDIYLRIPPSVDFPEPLYPEHFNVPVAMLEGACEKETRFCFHSPPRHGKSLLIRIAIIFYHFNFPGRYHVYVTYDNKLAMKAQGDLKWLLRELGIEHKSKGDEVIIGGGDRSGGTTIKFTSINSHITGYTVNGVLFIDDAISGADKASSLSARDKVWDYFQSEVLGRKMKFMSILMVMTRWSTDDLIGRTIETLGWEYVRLPMLCDDEKKDPNKRKLHEPLWPDVFPYETCMEFCNALGNGRVWYSQYQGNPLADGERFFDPSPSEYTALPPNLKTSIGFDFGYSGKGDWCVACVIGKDVSDGRIYVIRVVRKLTSLYKFVTDVRQLTHDYPGAALTWLHGGQESTISTILTSPEMMKNPLPKIDMLSSAGKLANASSYQEQWNEGMLLVPAEALRTVMMKAFIQNIVDFTGVDGASDDDADALAGAIRGLSKSKMHAPRYKARPLEAPSVNADDDDDDIRKNLAKQQRNMRNVNDPRSTGNAYRKR